MTNVKLKPKVSFRKANQLNLTLPEMKLIIPEEVKQSKSVITVLQRPSKQTSNSLF